MRWKLQYLSGTKFSFSFNFFLFFIRFDAAMQIFEKVSIQRCEGASVDEDGFDRLGSKAVYAFIYPNFMVNRCAIIQSIISPNEGLMFIQ